MYGSCATIIRAIGLLLYVTSGALVISAVGLSFYSISLKLFAIRTTGVITQIREAELDDGTWYKPIFTFIARDGTPYEITTTVSFSSNVRKIGDVIDVLYFEQIPRCARYDTFWNLFFHPILFSIFSPFSYFMGYMFYGVGVGMMKNG